MSKISLRAVSNSFQQQIRTASRKMRLKQTRMNLLLLSRLRAQRLPLDFTLQSLRKIEELEGILRFLPLEEYLQEIKKCKIVEYVFNQLNSLCLPPKECTNIDLLCCFRRSLLNVAACLSPCVALSKALVNECLLPMIEEINCLWEMEETFCTVNCLLGLSNFLSHQIFEQRVMIQLKISDFEGNIVKFLTESTNLKKLSKIGKIKLDTQIQLLKFLRTYLEHSSCSTNIQSPLICYLYALSKLPFEEEIAQLINLTFEALFPLNLSQEQAQTLFYLCTKIASLSSIELIASITSSHDIALTLLDVQSLVSLLDPSKYLQILREDYYRVIEVIVYNLLTSSKEEHRTRLMEGLERSGLDFDEVNLPLKELIG